MNGEPFPIIKPSDLFKFVTRLTGKEDILDTMHRCWQRGKQSQEIPFAEAPT